jgi:hypothetical protein
MATSPQSAQRRWVACALVCAVPVFGAFLSACGYIGDPLPPALNIAEPIRDLRVVEYGDQLMVAFTIPPLTTEGLVLKHLGTVDLRVGTGRNPFNVDEWASKAHKIPVSADKTGPVTAETPIAGWVGKEVVIAARVVNPKGRPSLWSNLVAFTVLPPVPVPADIKAESAPQGARLTWSSPEHTFRIFRRGPNEKEPVLLGTSEKPEYTDATAQFATAYEYRIQAIHGNAESVVSAAVPLTPVDTFPPAAPSGLSAVPGVGTIELVWERNTEADLRGYRVYRATGGGPFEVIAPMLDTPAYSDHQVESGKKYRYAVTALDQVGNESPKSTAVETAAP